ncbi:hypothetical protein JCM11251_005186 [Rhodosporidiobolus azoricus]
MAIDSNTYPPQNVLQAALHQQQPQPHPQPSLDVGAASTASSPESADGQQEGGEEKQEAMHLRGGCWYVDFVLFFGPTFRCLSQASSADRLLFPPTSVGCECCGCRLSVPCTIM